MVKQRLPSRRRLFPPRPHIHSSPMALWLAGEGGFHSRGNATEPNGDRQSFQRFRFFGKGALGLPARCGSGGTVCLVHASAAIKASVYPEIIRWPAQSVSVFGFINR